MKWYHYLIIIVIVLIAILFGIYIKNAFDKKDIEIDKQALALTQQQMYFEETIKGQKFEMEQERFAAIAVLNDKIKSKEKDSKYWKAQTSLLQLKVAELKASGIGTTVEDTDSAGSFFRVNFKGTRDLFTYEGYTKQYTESNISPYYWLHVKIKPIEVRSTFFRDNNGLWKISTMSLTEGITLKANNVIDSTFYNFIANENFEDSGNNSNKSEYLPIGLRFKMNFLIQNSPYLTQTETIQSDISLEFYVYYFNVTYHAVYNKFSFGLFYDWNIHKMFNKIF